MIGSDARADKRPVVFWMTDGVQPGDIVMAAGGSLEDVKEVQLWRLEDSARGLPGETLPQPPLDVLRVNTLQPNYDTVKFKLPSTFTRGLYGMQVPGAKPFVLNRPQLWFIQPTKLLPGLADNQVAAGIEVQIIGKDLLLPDDSGDATIAIRPAGGEWRQISPLKAERYSMIALLPAELANGTYDLSVHNGSGGPHGWSKQISFAVMTPQSWPQERWNVREHGALGDDVHDDSDAIRSVLAKAEANGGGIVYFPWGTYRLRGYIVIPNRVVLLGEERDATILKWPEDMPTAISDFRRAAIYTSGQFGLEQLTIIARSVDTTLSDLSGENLHSNPDGKELLRYVKPWTQYRDVFVRRVRFQNWLDAGRPAITEDLALDRKFYLTDQSFNFRTAACRNFEVSDCIFQGGSNQFMGLMNARVTNNSFSNEMNYCWTVLGGGARRLVCTDNDIRASSSYGFGSIGLQYVYSARNVSRNFVRGEREAMTLDVSSMPSMRSMADYWGTPIAVSNDSDNVTLRFAPPSAPANDNGFMTGFVPGSFRGGTATLHSDPAGEIRTILDNTEDSVKLDKPWNKAPETIPGAPKVELQARKNKFGTNAWVGTIDSAGPATLAARLDKDWIPNEFVGDVVVVFTGKGAGQYRAVKSNTERQLLLDRPWDVLPEKGEAIGIWAVTRHIIFYKCQGYDTSDFAQLWGSGYDFVIDSCHTERNQGVWGQMGWFLQVRNTESSYGYSFHKGVGPHGPTPEGNSPYALVGFNGGPLRVTKFGSVQYPQFPPGTSIMVDQLLGRPIPTGRGIVLRRNHLMWNERLVLGSAGNPSAPVRFIDAVIDNNLVEHSAVGLQLGGDVERVVASGNRFVDVKQPYSVVRPGSLLTLNP